jgi:hypothetical protein
VKTKVLIALCLVLSFGLLHAEDMFGAFKIVTSPKGADVNLYDLDMFLCATPSPVYPVLTDEYMELREGIPGRPIMLMITKKGYVPLKKEIFVPYLYTNAEDALDNPSVFKFELEKDYKNLHWQVSVYYLYRYRHPRPHHLNNPHFRPWCPPWHDDHGYHPGGGDHPWHPGDGDHHGGPGDGGHHNPPGGGTNPPPPPHGGVFTTPPNLGYTPVSDTKPHLKTSNPKPDPVGEPVLVQTKPNKPDKPNKTTSLAKPEKESKTKTEKPLVNISKPDKKTNKTEVSKDVTNKTKDEQEEPKKKKKDKTK